MKSDALFDFFTDPDGGFAKQWDDGYKKGHREGLLSGVGIGMAVMAILYIVMVFI